MVMLPPEQPLAEPRLDITGGTLQLDRDIIYCWTERGLDPFSSAVNTNRNVVRITIQVDGRHLSKTGICGCIIRINRRIPGCWKSS